MARTFLLVGDRELALLARGIVSKRIAKRAGELDAALEDRLKRNAARPDRKRMAKAALRA